MSPALFEPSGTITMCYARSYLRRLPRLPLLHHNVPASAVLAFPDQDVVVVPTFSNFCVIRRYQLTFIDCSGGLGRLGDIVSEFGMRLSKSGVPCQPHTGPFRLRGGAVIVAAQHLQATRSYIGTREAM